MSFADNFSISLCKMFYLFIYLFFPSALEIITYVYSSDIQVSYIVSGFNMHHSFSY